MELNLDDFDEFELVLLDSFGFIPKKSEVYEYLYSLPKNLVNNIKKYGFTDKIRNKLIDFYTQEPINIGDVIKKLEIQKNSPRITKR